MNNQVVNFNNARIILSHERSNKAVLDIYPSQHLLTYVREGVLMVKIGKEKHCFSKGELVLFKKFTRATITKKISDENHKFSSIVFTFHEDLIAEAFLQLNLPMDKKQLVPSASIIPIQSNPVLKSFISSLQLFFEQGIEMDAQLARLKTLEAIIGILKADNNIIRQLQDFSIRSKADLHHYMNHHFLENKSLATFARESGRSLSSFKRDFAELYGVPPAKWIKEKRLQHAHHLLSTSNKKSSEIYLLCGFEDLAHFSKSFKKQYKVNPSQIFLNRTDKQLNLPEQTA